MLNSGGENVKNIQLCRRDIMAVKKIFICLLPLIVLLGCSGVQTTKKTKRKLSAQEYVKAGHIALEQGDWEQAAFSFNRAIKVNPQYAPAYSGAAYVLATKNQPEKAVEFAEKAVSIDNKSFEAQFYRGRIVLMTKPENWFNRAIHSFDEALKIKSMHEETMFYKAEAYREHGDMQQAKAMYTTVHELGGELAQQANEQILYLDAYMAAAPRTQVGADMLLVDKINRADVAALLGAELNIVNLMHRRNPNYAGGNNKQWQTAESKRISVANSINDILGHWAEAWIRDAVQVGAMDVYPDNSFRPSQIMQRMNMALMLQNIIIESTGNTSLYTAFINSAPRFVDVPHTHYAFNAICLVTEYNIMPMSGAGDQFHLNGPVSGLDALLALRNLERYLNRSF
jgi:tetratricopeptide (TPR) repeat protein